MFAARVRYDRWAEYEALAQEFIDDKRRHVNGMSADEIAVVKKMVECRISETQSVISVLRLREAELRTVAYRLGQELGKKVRINVHD